MACKANVLTLYRPLLTLGRLSVTNGNTEAWGWRCLPVTAHSQPWTEALRESWSF